MRAFYVLQGVHLECIGILTENIQREVPVDVVSEVAREQLEATLLSKVKHREVPAVLNDGEHALTRQKLEAIVSFVPGRVQEATYFFLLPLIMYDLVIVFGNYQELIRLVLFEGAYLLEVQLLVTDLRLECHLPSSLLVNKGSKAEGTFGAEEQLELPWRVSRGY